MTEVEASVADEGLRQAVRRLFEETRRRLVETGTRNRLVHVNRQSRRSNVLDIINERSDDIYNILVAGRTTMRFLATGRDKGDARDTPSLAPSPSDETFDPARYTDNQLETRLGPDGLQKRLLKLARDARTAEEEQGINILYLALGFLTWFEDKSSDVKREAPLILLPVELVRNARTSTFDIRAREDDIVTNLPLQERLKVDFGIRLPDVEPDDGWGPSHYFDAVSQVIAERERWSIDRDGMQLGFFSFAKLLMFRDLDPDNWPGNALAGHDLTRGLLYEGFEPEEPMFGKEDDLDERLQPHELFHVVDADASQAKVIEEVRSGRNLVVQGPPGTGKSQTITNIIAGAVRDGKRVLFVAEKMAALSVVHKNLTKVGLQDICLELHSKTANKKAVHGELARTLSAGQAIPAMPSEPDLLEAARDRLNRIARHLHLVQGASEESAFSILGQQVRFAGLGAPPPRLEAPNLEKIPRRDAVRVSDAIREYGSALENAGSPSEHPFAGTARLDLQPTDLARLEQRLVEAASLVSALAGAISAAADALGTEVSVCFATAAKLTDQLRRLTNVPEADEALLIRLFELEAKPRLRETLAIGAEWRDAREASESVFVSAAWSADVALLRAPVAAGQSSFFARWGSAYRNASRQLAGLLAQPLPKSAQDRTQLIDRLLSIQSLRDAWRQDETWCATTVADAWSGERTSFAALTAALDWSEMASAGELSVVPQMIVRLARDPERAMRLREGVEKAASTAASQLAALVDTLGLDIETCLGTSDRAIVPLKALAEKLSRMAAAVDRYDEWAQLVRLRSILKAEELDALVVLMDVGSLHGESAATEFLFARAEAIWKSTIEGNPVVASLRDTDRHKLVQEFSRLEKQRLKDCVTAIRGGHLRQLPQGARGAMAVIRGELGKRRAHIPLRRLFTGAAEAIQRIKPVLLMSPISVAQFLPPGSIEFDLLLIDEASQVRPEDALGAIARAKQIVVVGDQKQLPPSNFFDKLASNDGDEEDDEDEESPLDGAAKVGVMESILTLCEARGLAPRMLEWHYRSRDPSLIRVSNREFYKNGLILPPSPLQNDPSYGLTFTHVAGAYDRGGKRDNRLEGVAIVRRVIEHAEREPSLSLGIVTFSSAQRNLITELLEYERRQNAGLDIFLREGGAEDVFVKNIENVQGDERDVILVSVGYGPTEAGGRLTSMSFGPVNLEGGERRLNVLFTRARLRCEVFVSFDPGDIDLAKTSKEGPRVLKRFLEFAKTGQIDEKTATGADADTPFEAEVADAIRRLGYHVDHQVGSAGFLIDLGVCHPERPGTYILAVECDGSTYHSALWARERDRLRQGVLEHLGWQFHRVWSTDWFYRRTAELERLKTALEVAVKASDEGIVIEGANEGLPPMATTQAPPAVPVFDIPEAPVRKMPHYARSQISVRSYTEPHEADPQLLARLAAQIVADEGPIHQEEVARRIASAFGKERAGVRIVATVQRALRTAQRRPEYLLQREGPFWSTTAQMASPSVRDRSLESGPLCKAANIAMSEINESLRISMEDNAGGSDQEIIRAASRLLGFKRVGPDLQIRMQAGLQQIQKPAP